MIAMLPFGGQSSDHVRVPPIYYDTNKELLTSSTSTTPLSSNYNSRLIANNITRNSNVRLLNGASKRGRRSNVPPELREQTRRLKKQNMERRRRACISDKMNALHNLAMNLIGANPHDCPKVEKADILSLCYKVFEGIATIANEEPELRERLRQLRNNVPQTTPIKVSTSTPIQTDQICKSQTTDAVFENPSFTANSTPITTTPTTANTTNIATIPTCNYANDGSTMPIGHKKYLHKKMYKNLKLKLNKSNLPDSGFDQSSISSVLPVVTTTTTTVPATTLSPSSFLLGQVSFESDKENQLPQNFYANHVISPLELKRSIKTENYSLMNNSINLFQDSGFVSPNSWNSHNSSSQYLNTTPISTSSLGNRSIHKSLSPYSIPISATKNVITNPVINRTELCNRIKQINNFKSNENLSAFKKCNKTDQCSSKTRDSLSVWRPYLD